jgi:hypothetical protein
MRDHLLHRLLILGQGPSKHGHEGAYRQSQPRGFVEGGRKEIERARFRHSHFNIAR